MKLPQPGDKVKFNIRNPNWEKPMEAEGIVSTVSERFGGVITINSGSIITDEMIIRLDSLR